jgi:ubiquinone/menaquinone biosynthesis C-methylase UbiE
MIEFSFLLPTRGRTDQVQRFAASVIKTAANLNQIEVILCVDEDDAGSHQIDCSPLASRTVVVTAGISMGALNQACFTASQGRYIMLINDDVVVRTKEWDAKIRSLFRSIQDDILLVHVNDLLFRDKLCTFPILSRRACLEIGLCPLEYHRYRLDDHIFDTYCLLAHLGHKRIVYLEDVVFEHLNHCHQAPNTAGQTFRSSCCKMYVPNPEILSRDAAVYDARTAERKQNAVRLATLIEQTAAEVRSRQLLTALQDVADTRTLRRPENMIRIPPRTDRPSTAAVTVAVVTRDLRSHFARECLERVKSYTEDFDLLVLDNNGSTRFNHPREINRILKSTTSDFVVLMDDDVFVEPGWLTGLLGAMNEKTGVVVPMHKDSRGELSFSGIYLMGDECGTHAHLTDVPAAPRVTQCACSALMLVDRRKCGHIRFNEEYNKYFLDIDYSLRIWEAGFQVVCTPGATVTHLGGATMPRHTRMSQMLFNRDLPVFVREWIENRRLQRLAADVWSRHPYLNEQCETPRRIVRLAGDCNELTIAEFQREIEACHAQSAAYPLWRGLLVTSLRRQLRHSVGRCDSDRAQACRRWLRSLTGTVETFGGPIPRFVASRKGYNLVECGRQAIAISPALGHVDVRDPETKFLKGVLHTDNIDKLRALVDARPLSSAEEVAAVDLDESPPQETAVQNYLKRGYLRSRMAVKRSLARVGFEFEGPFSVSAVLQGRYFRLDPHSRLKTAWNTVERLAAQFTHIGDRMKQSIQHAGHRLAGIPAWQSAFAANGPTAEAALAQPGRPRSRLGAGRTPSLQSAAPPAPMHEFDMNVASHAAELVLKDHAGFDIFYFNTKYFGVASGKGAFQLQRVRNGELGMYFVGNTITEVTSEISRVTSQTSKPKALVTCALRRRELLNHLPLLNDLDVQLLVSAEDSRQYRSYKAHVYADRLGKQTAQFDLSQLAPDLLAALQAERFDVVVLPTDRFAWRMLHAEQLAIALSARLTMTYDDGRKQTYKGEDLHRIIYNTAYLNSMFCHVPDLAGKTVLDVGCSDGLVCNLLMSENPERIVGIDVLETVGCRFPHPQISYHRMDATHTDFDDQTFDVCVSIATFEHVPDPVSVFREMKRVTVSGGYCYIQAGPLYHSPFGHHMFGFFDEQPWIHLRRTKAEIVDYARQTGADQRIKQSFGKDVVRYVDEMINRDHVNQKFFGEYGIHEFVKSEKCELVFFNQSYEGKSLLTPQILSELATYDRQDLIAHGFEVLFRVP